MTYLVSSIFIIFGAFLTLILHELSHAIVVWILGGKVLGFYPYPHFKDGNFYFARIRSEGFNKGKLFYLVPILKASLFLLLWIGLGFIFWYFWILAFWELLDLGNWVQGYIRKSSRNDGGKYRGMK